MPYLEPLTTPQTTAIRAGNFHSSAYALVNPVNIVFSARVNQASFDSTFAAIEFDTVDTGTITDVLSGFTVYISDAAEDVLTPAFILRARGDGVAGTSIDINETSFDIQDDQYITVVKEVVGHEILGQYIGRTAKVDWDIDFRELLPLVTGLQSAYGKKLVSNSAIFSFPAVGFAVNRSASISSWLWDADGGAFVNGTVATDAQPDIEYTTAGVYWPRVTVADDGGRTNWFTMPVFVMSSDMSDAFVIKGIDNLSITSRIGVGDELTFAAFSEEFAPIPSRSVIVVWEEPYYDGDTDPVTDNVLFVGRLKKETPRGQISGADGPTPDTNFTCEGILAQMNRIRSPQLALSFSATPTEFGQIDGMTQWRIVCFVLSEFSTFLNLCSLRFDDETEDYLNAEDNTEDKALLASVNGLLSARKSALNISRQGELYGAQSAVFLSDTDRGLLDTIHKFTTADIFQYTAPSDKVPTVGSVDVFGGGYSTADGSLRVIRAVAPAVASLEAQGGAKPIDGILLATDGTATEQQDELEQISGNELADANPKDKPAIIILDGFYFINPTNFQWWGLILATTDNNRGIEYTTNDRFLIDSVNLAYDNILNTWNTSIVQRAETEGVGAKVISQVQPGAIPPSLPDLPAIPAYPAFPANDEIYLPTGWNDFNLPAIGQNDAMIIITPLPASSLIDAQTIKGSVCGMWTSDTNQLYITTDFTEGDIPTWNPVFTAESPFDIVDFKFDPYTQGAYLLTNDGSGNSVLYSTDDIFASIPSWNECDTVLDDIDYTTLRTTSNPDELYIFGIDTRTESGVVARLDGDGTSGLAPSNGPIPGASSIAPGIYNASTDKYDGQAGSDGGTVCDIEYGIKGAGQVTRIQMNGTIKRVLGDATGGSRTMRMGIDGTLVKSFAFQSVPENQTLGITYDAPAPISASTVYYHNTVDKLGSSEAIINRITVATVDPGDSKNGSRRSTDGGATLFSLQKTEGVIDSGATDSGFDTDAVGDIAYAPTDDIIQGNDDNDGYADKTGSDSVGTYAKAIWAYGKNASKDTIFASAAEFVGQTMILIVSDTPSDITPNDGSFNGIVIGRNAICMSRVSDTHMWFIGTFNTTTKLCYTDDAGTIWTFPVLSLTTGATHIRVKDTNTDQVYISDGSVIHYSSDGGDNWRDKTTPSLAVQGVEVR